MYQATDIVNENLRRLRELRLPYNPITGEGSFSTPRTKVDIPGFPVKDLWLPTDMVNTDFMKALMKAGVKEMMNLTFHSAFTVPNYNSFITIFNQIRIKYDFEFWAYQLAVISEKGGGKDIPFLLNRAQRIYLKELETLRLEGKPIDIILLKARQWGGSTLTQIYMLWIQLVHRKNWNSVICGAVKSQASTVTGMLSKVIKNYKTWATDGKPLSTHPFEHSQNTRVIDYSNCYYSVGSAEEPDNLRSQDISMAHLTEVGIWRDTKGKKPEDLVQSIFSSILSGAYTMKVLESTAKGVGNYFHRTWLSANKKEGEAGKNNFTPVFIPWYYIDIYSKPILYKDYFPFIKSMTDSERHMFELGATLEAINWYRDKKKEVNDEWRLCSEFPSTPEEAFQSTGRRVFPVSYVDNVRRTCIEPCFYGYFEGDSEKGQHSLSNVKYIPFKDNEGVKEGCFRIWSLPDNTEKIRDRYIVSVDPGGVSNDSDPSEIKVADRYPMIEGGVPEIVAEWHGHCDLDVLAWKAAQCAKAYSDALLVIESNTLETDGTEGDNFEYILDEVKEYYDNLYSRTSPEQIREGAPTRYGFHTNPKTKPMVINFLKAAMKNVLYIERSIETTYEYDLFELKENGRQMGAVEGNHDDRVMATAILVYVCYKWDTPKRIETVNNNIRRKTEIVSEASF